MFGPWATPMVVAETKQSEEILLHPTSIPSSLKAKLPYVLATDMMKSRSSGKAKRKGGKNGKGVKVKQGVDGTTWNMISMTFPYTRAMMLPNHVHRFRQEIELGTLLTTSTTLPTFGNYNFVLSSLSGVTAYTSLFDQYRVELLEIWVTASSISGDVGLSSRIATVIDFDDSTNLVAFSDALEYETCVDVNSSDGHYRRFVPHIAVAAYSGVFTSFANETAPWIDVASTGVQHYGLKIAAQPMSVSHAITAKCRVTLGFKNVR